MTVTTLTLADFLLARIAEVEGRADAADAAQLTTWATIADRAESVGGPSVGRFILRTPPSRVLTECEAKRRIVRDEPGYGEGDYYSGRDYQYDLTLRALAAVYADHPDYRDEWKP